MICYKDKSWCSASLGDPNERCKNYLCDRNFTQEEKNKAIKWWGNVDFPYSNKDFKKEGCGYINENTKS